MKKLLKLLTIVLLIPITVLADGAGPSTYEYDVTVSNPKGTTTHEKKEKIAYDTKLTITSEYKIGDKYYGQICDENYDNCDLVNLSDVTILSEIDINKMKEESQNYFEYQYSVYDSKIKLYKGPSAYYGEPTIINIPKGTILKSKIYGGIFKYFEYENYAGWIITPETHIYSDTVFGDERSPLIEVLSGDEKYIMLEDIALYDGPVSNTKNGKKILAYEKFDILYQYAVNGTGINLYVKSGDNEGWMYANCTGSEYPDIYAFSIGYSFVIATEEVKLYDRINGKEIGKLDSNVVYDGKYYETINLQDNNSLWNYVELTNGTSGWFISTDNIIVGNYVVEGNLNNNYTVYDNLENGKIIGSFSKNDRVSYRLKYYSEDNIWYYLESDNLKGWIVSPSNVHIFNNETIHDPNDDLIIQKDEDKETESDGFSLAEVIVYSSLGAIILALSVIIVIRLVNSKKGKKD